MFAVEGVYANGMVSIKEPVPVNTQYDVIVTFLKPLDKEEKDEKRERKFAALNRITGILFGSTMSLEEARAERLGRQ